MTLTRGRRAASSAGAILLAAVLAGCAGEARDAPVLGNPKVVVDRTADNLTEIFVHSAFGERPYERIVVRVDNVTVAERNFTYAANAKVGPGNFSLTVDVYAASANYTVSALIRPDPLEKSTEVAIYDARQATYGSLRGSNLPWVKIIDEAPSVVRG